MVHIPSVFTSLLSDVKELKEDAFPVRLNFAPQFDSVLLANTTFLFCFEDCEVGETRLILFRGDLNRKVSKYGIVW